MKHPLLRWLLPIVRYGLCLVALVFLYNMVSWHDYIILHNGNEVRLLEQTPAGFRVLIEDNEVVIPADQVAYLTVEDRRLPNIKYGIKSVVTQIDRWKAALAILMFLPVPFLSGMRLVWMLGMQDVRLRLWNAIKLTFAGNFFNFALPGTTGGDLIKAYYVTRFTQHKTEAVTTIFLDRVVGLLGLMFLASLMFLYSWNTIDWDPERRGYMGGMLAIIWGGLAVGAVFVFSKRLRHMIRLPSLAARLPAGGQLLRIGRATVKIREHRGLIAASLAITIVLQLCVLISAYFMARALGMAGPFQLYFICVPIGFLIAAIPISPPQAFGVMEAAYIGFFAQDGLNSESRAVTFALAVRVIQLFWAIPGVLVPLLGAHTPTKEELAALEAPDETLPEDLAAPAEAPISEPDA